MKVLLVTMYWPPAGGGGVQRPLKLATHLPALGIETHVLAPDDPKWLHRDEELRPPTQAFVHRARYLGPRARLPSEEMHGLGGTDLMLMKARLAYRRLLLPDASVTWAATAVPAAVRIVKREGIDVVITTSPPLSMNLIGASVKRLTGIPWVADQRDSMVRNADRRFERTAVRS
jgi:glycosyltransferase involved in cell wall biosynthesis